MQYTGTFDDMRAGTKEEFRASLIELLQDPEFKSVVSKAAPNFSFDSFGATLDTIRTPNDFHREVVAAVIKEFLKNITEGYAFEGIENLTSEPSILMSNHRDIVMDIIFIALGAVKAGVEVPQIAIGDNLMARPWIEKFVRMNGAFLVKRGLSPAAQIKAFAQLSAYIRNAITIENKSVWMAQREGRAKNSNDRTQESLIKMLALSGSGSIVENISSLNITPVALSYEFDPCDYLKAVELHERRANPNYKKKEGEDLRSMQTGITGYKGRVVCSFLPSINSDITTPAIQALPRKEQAAEICRIIDSKIHKAYSIFEINCLAHDALYESNFAEQCDVERVGKAFEYLQSRIEAAATEIQNPDVNFLRRTIYEMYAYPLRNQMEALNSNTDNNK